MGNTETSVFSVLESTKGLLEDKPWKKAWGVGTEHPSATIKHLDWGSGLLYNREITTLNVRAIKPNYFSSPLQHKMLSLGLTDLLPPCWSAQYRTPVWGPQSSLQSALRKAWQFPACSVQILYWRRKQTEQAPSGEQNSISGGTVDIELYAQYLWKQHTNWKTSPPRPRKSPRAPT